MDQTQVPPPTSFVLLQLVTEEVAGDSAEQPDVGPIGGRAPGGRRGDPRRRFDSRVAGELGCRAAFTLARVRDRGSLAQILYWAHKGRLIAFDGAHAERAGWVPVESSHLRHRCERDSVRRASWRPLGASSHPLNPNHAGPVLIIAATLSFSIGFWNF
jgi:hypothetical protein